MIQDMLHEQKGINWNDYSTVCKRGTSCFYTEVEYEDGVRRAEWFIDEDMPILKGDDRNYVDNLILVGEGM